MMSLPSPAFSLDALLNDSVATVYHGELLGYVKEQLQLNAAQQEACHAPLNSALQVLAGAGTGKTMLITARMLTLMHELIEQGVDSPESRILVMTFTKKAAGEMRERIHQHLRLSGYTGPMPHENITTFNSFGQGFLKRHAREAGLNAQTTVLDEQETHAIREAITQRILKGNTTNIQSTLEQAGLWNEATPRASISTRILSPDALLGLPVHHALEDLLQGLWGVVLKAKSYGLRPAQFRTLAHEQTRQFSDTIERLPIEQNGVPLNSLDGLYRAWQQHLKWVASKSWLHEIQQLPEFAESADTKAAYKALLHTDAFKQHPQIKLNLKSKKQPVEIVAVEQSQWQAHQQHTDLELVLADMAAAMFALYQERLHLDNAMDYDDQINRTLHTLQQYPEIAKRYQHWFQAIMVDEFQDTNGSQLELLKHLMHHPRDGWDSPNLTVVGDVKQSIYGFRFAQKENVHLIFEGLETRRVALVENYRSVPGVLAVANTLAAHTAETRADQDPFLVPQVASLAEGAVEARGWYFGERSAEGGWANDVGWLKECAIRVCITQLVQDIEALGTDALSQLCVLAKNHHDLDAVATALHELGIPAVRDVDAQLFRHALVKQAWALLRLLHRPDDTEALVRFLQPFIPATPLLYAFQTLKQASRDHVALEGVSATATLFEQVVQVLSVPGPMQHTFSTEARTALLEMAHRSKQDALRFRYGPPHEALGQWTPLLQAAYPELDNPQDTLQLLAFQDYCQYVYEQKGRGYQLDALLKQIMQASQNSRFTLPLRESVRLNRANAIRLMTVHASKGLEFNRVYIFWFSRPRPNRDSLTFDPQIPPQQGVGLLAHKTLNAGTPADTLKYSIYKQLWFKPRAEYEERRLFYVALTRARHCVQVLADAKLLEAYPWLMLEAASQDIVHAPEILEEAHNSTPFQQAYESWYALIKSSSRENDGQSPHWLPGFTLPQAEPSQLAHLDATARQQLQQWRSQAPVLPVLSFSMLNALEQCPVQYWYKYIKQWPVLTPKPQQTRLNDTQRASLRGQALHRMLEAYYRFYTTTDDADRQVLLKAILVQATGGLLEPDAAQIMQETRQIYNRFLHSAYTIPALQEAGYQVISGEYTLRFTLAPETTGLKTPQTFKSVIDVLLYHPERDVYGMIDFKTNREFSPKQHDVYLEQLALYRLGLLQNNPHMAFPREECRIVHLPHEGAQHEYVLAERTDSSALTPWLREQLQQLETLAQVETPPLLAEGHTPPCRFCGFQEDCEQAQGV
jgi:superfamily I DNA/RNA helicase/RecB family exonuclease